MLPHTPHIDHFGGLSEIIRRTDAEVAIHPLDQRAVAAYDERAMRSRYAFDRFLRQAGVEASRRAAVLDEFGYFKGRIQSVAVARPLCDGDILDGLRIIHTPGHSPGHVCLAMGNLLWPEITSWRDSSGRKCGRRDRWATT